MPTWNLRRFCRPETIRQIKPQNLLQFLEPHQSFFHSRGFPLPSSNTLDQFNFASLIEIFLSPDSETPHELIESLYLVDELSTTEGMHSLLNEIEDRKVKCSVGFDDSPSDVAVRLWLLDPTLLRRKHAETQVSKVRSFSTFQSNSKEKLLFKPPTQKQLAALTEELDSTFEKKKWGRGSRVILGSAGEESWFVVSHGESVQRAESLERQQPTVTTFRPFKHDYVIYHYSASKISILIDSVFVWIVPRWHFVLGGTG